ncbi:MAG: carbohydrate-binding domain-containing protein [Bacteroidaceae bacterium]|nr:carbohydrate-binding domain-containing protein [Bacteroidaceae bacterium]
MKNKHLFLLALTGFVTCNTWAQSVNFHQRNGIVRFMDYAEMDSINFSDDETFASFYMGNSIVTYPLQQIDSLTFNCNVSSAKAFPDGTEFKDLVTNSVSPVYTNNGEDTEEIYSQTKTIVITYNGSSASVNTSVEGVDISISGADVTVKSTKGKVRYRLTGTTQNGSFKMLANDEVTEENKKFVLEFKDANITNLDGPAINIQSGKSVYVNIASGTTNYLKDGTMYFGPEGEDRKGTFFSEGQLIIDGSGTLNITSYGGHGLCSDDYIHLRKTCGTININSAKDGINTKDHLIMLGGTVNITAQDDGVTVSEGFVGMYGGELRINSVDNGISADYSANDTTHIDILGGYTEINTTGPKGHAIATSGKLNISNAVIKADAKGAASKAVSADLDITIADSYLKLQTSGNPLYDDAEADYSSAAGIRAKSSLAVSKSEIAILSSGEGGKGINAIGNVTLNESNITVVTEGNSFSNGTENVRPRAIDAGSLTIQGNNLLNVASSHAAIYTEQDLNISGGETFAFSTDNSVKCINVKGNTNHTGGLFMRSIGK